MEVTVGLFAGPREYLKPPEVRSTTKTVFVMTAEYRGSELDESAISLIGKEWPNRDSSQLVYRHPRSRSPCAASRVSTTRYGQIGPLP